MLIKKIIRKGVELTLRYGERTRRHLWPRIPRRLQGRHLRHVHGPEAPAKSGPLLFSKYFGDARFLAIFLAYYRRLGVAQFVLLDLSAGGDLPAHLGEATDVAVWRPTRDDPRRAIHWLNFLRHRYALGRWCLSVDPYDLLVFPRCETRNLPELIEFLGLERRRQLAALVIDMYGAGVQPPPRPADEAELFATMKYFDGTGYLTRPIDRHRQVVVQGGPQRRLVYGVIPEKAPAVNAMPLVKWRKDYHYVSGNRLLVPRRANTVHCKWHTNPTGCLLRFALLAPSDHLYRMTAAEGAVFPEKFSRAYAGFGKLHNQVLSNDGSVEYRGSRTLAELGLAHVGQWF